jgi:hypothetical protein
MSESNKYTKEQLRFILTDCPVEYGMAQALNEESLVRTLLSSGIYPIKIKPASIRDVKIFKLNKIKNSANKPKKKPYESFTYLDHRAERHGISKVLLFSSIPIIILILYYIIKNIN